MTILASVVDATTFHFDRNDVQRRAVMSASSLRVEINSAHSGMTNGHAYRVERESNIIVSVQGSFLEDEMPELEEVQAAELYAVSGKAIRMGVWWAYRRTPDRSVSA